jgi:phosphopantothenoylcysteine synthetase/decarboxylase
MSAAVADYAPVHLQRQKIKKSGDDLVIKLAKTRDVLVAMRGEFKFKGLLVGFAAETENVRGNALEKMKSKGCDLMVANDVSRSDIGFDSEYNAVIIFGADGSEQIVSRQLKQDVAISILDAMESAAAKS